MTVVDLFKLPFKISTYSNEDLGGLWEQYVTEQAKAGVIVVVRESSSYHSLLRRIAGAYEQVHLEADLPAKEHFVILGRFRLYDLGKMDSYKFAVPLSDVETVTGDDFKRSILPYTGLTHLFDIRITKLNESFAGDRRWRDLQLKGHGWDILHVEKTRV